MKKLLWLLIIILSSFTTYSKEYSIKNLNIKDGLPNSTVNCLVQDSLGFLWIGTSNGLCKYDGYNFELIPLINESADEEITSLKLTSDNYLWIATNGGNLSCYNITLEDFVSIQISQSNEMSKIISFELQNDTILWIGTPYDLKKYVARKNNSNEIFLSQKELLTPNPAITNRNNNFITCLKTHQDGNALWVGTNSRLFLLDINTSKFKDIYTANKWAVRTINQISKDQLIIGFWKSGMLQIDNQGEIATNTYFDFIENKIGTFRIISFLKESDNSYWIGTRENGVFNFTSRGETINSKQFKFNPTRVESLGSNSVSCIIKDRSNIIWLGQINEGGLSKIISDRYQLHFIKETNKLNVNSILARSQKKLWVGTQGNGLIYFDVQHNKKTVLKKSRQKQTNIGHNIVNVIHEDSHRNLWIGTHGGGIKILPRNTVEEIEGNKPLGQLNLLSLTREQYPTLTNYVTDICSDHNGQVWIGTYQGLFYIKSKNVVEGSDNILADPNQLIIRNFFHNNKLLKKISIISLYIDKSGLLWICTHNDGLLRIDPNNLETDNIVTFKHDNPINRSILSNKVFNCRQDELNRLWVTSSKGLDAINLNDFSVEPILTITNIGNSELRSLAFDGNGYCWLGLDYGIYCYNLTNSEIKKYYRASVHGNFTKYGGIYNLNDGTMFFGTKNGVTFFHPDSIDNTKVDIPFYITSLKINGEKVNPDKKVNGRIILTKNINQTAGITLIDKDHQVSFDVALLDYLDRTSIEYKYLLEGASSLWNTLSQGQHTFSFTNLKKGNYTLRIKATSSDGAWDSKEIKLNIKVLPPLWQSTYAIIFYSILLLVFLYLFWRYSIIREKEKNKLKLIQIEKEKSEELNNLKLQFFTNISHEFRTPLSLILAPLEIIINKVKDLETSQQLKLIQRNANRLLFLINQIIDIRKIDAGKIKLSYESVNMKRFLHDIFKVFQFHARKKDIDFQFDEPTEQICTSIDKYYIESVFYNILSNAFHFTEPGGSIKITVFLSGQFACVSITDTGKGISQDEIPKIFERFYHLPLKGVEWRGSGIGLSYSKSIIDLHKGEIEVKSEVNKGSTFTVKLRLHNAQVLSEDETISQSVQKNIIQGLDSVISEENDFLKNSFAKQANGKKVHSILVVEDNHDLRKFIKEQLEVKYNVIEAENGRIAWEFLQTKHTDLVITDLMMPEMDGMELCSLIKNAKDLSHVPVIMLTAKNQEEERIAGYKNGADAYIFKPFKFRFLSLRIENILALKANIKKQLSDNLCVTSNVKIESREKIFIDKTIALVEENISNSEFNVDDMYKSLGFSRTSFYRKIKELTGYSAKEFVREIRLQHACQMFQVTDITVNEVAYSTGFESTSYFSKCFKKRFTVSPVDYKKSHKIEF